MKRLLTPVLFLLLIVSDGIAQNIGAALSGGINITQVDGDALSGFHKAGWNFGAMGLIPISDHFSVSLEVSYTQKGSRSQGKIDNPANSYLLRLNYAEIPVLINYHDRDKLIFGAGIGYGTLVGFYEEIGGLENVYTKIPYRSTDINALVSGTFLATPKIGINIRWAYSVIPIAGFSRPPSKISSQFNHLVTFRLAWYFLGEGVGSDK